MKKIRFLAAILLCVNIFCGGCGYTNTEERLLRIHVRADSDSPAAQAVKAEVVAAVQYYLSDELSAAKSYDEAYRAVQARVETLSLLAAAVLRRCGFGYGASATLTREYFPARMYDGKTVESGEYDALVIRLGTGGGDNWWCVLYPQLCVTASAEKEAVYKSIIAELLRQQ